MDFKKKSVILISLFLVFICLTPVQAHSGRTDSSGGHRDNKNASGLGYYHYHHGMGPHLHPNGVCPYGYGQSTSGSTSTYSVPVVATPAPAPIVPTVYHNGQRMYFDVSPAIDDGRTLVPLRGVFEAMGATLTWDTATQTATAVKGNMTVVITIGSLYPTINGQVQTLDVPAKIVNGRTLAPLRFAGEAFGESVAWDESTHTININS